jgi:hypothetical protein
MLECVASRFLVGIVLLTAIGARPAVGLQQPIQIRGAPTGSVTATRVVTIGAPEGANALTGEPNDISRDSRGRFFVVSLQVPYEIRVFDSKGTFLRRFGRKGSGPGEYEFIWSLVHGPGDTLFVFDSSLERITVIAPDGSVVHSAPLALPSLADRPVYLGNGRFAVHARLPARQRDYSPLHFTNLAGKVERSFGGQAAPYRRDLQPYLGRRRIAAAANGVWSAHWARYRIEQWDRNGQLRAVVEREADWFKPYATSAPLPRTRDVPPAPRIRTFHEDSAGRLWVVVLVPGEKWRSGLGNNRVGPNGRTMIEITDPASYENILVEVLDLRSRTVLGSIRVPHNRAFVLDNGQLAIYREDAEGTPFMDILRLSLPPALTR